MLANTPEMYEAHFGVPMSGAVLNTLNTRLDAHAIAFMLDHADAPRAASPTASSRRPSSARSRWSPGVPLVVDVDDAEYAGEGTRLGDVDYESLLAEGDPVYDWQPPADEWNAISLNYTSGTTGNPKGVVYHHRGAYLNALCNVLPRRRCRRTRSTCGPCPCSTATAGACRGASRRRPAPASACARWTPSGSSG